MKPYVTISYAQSLDGRIATALGKSQWIGGPESLRLAHELRRDHDGILVGIGTVLQDDPQLTCRLPEGSKNPIRIVLDTHLSMKPDCRLMKSLTEAPLWIFHGPSVEERKKAELGSAGAVLIETPLAEDRLDLDMVLNFLAEKGIKTLFVEGGAHIITAFLKQGLTDRLLAVTAPLIIGQGIEAVGDLQIRDIPGALRPRQVRHWALGQDWATELLF